MQMRMPNASTSAHGTGETSFPVQMQAHPDDGEYWNLRADIASRRSGIRDLVQAAALVQQERPWCDNAHCFW